jgi:hypothetical protein
MYFLRNLLMTSHPFQLQADEKSREEYQRQIDLGREETTHYKLRVDELQAKLQEVRPSLSAIISWWVFFYKRFWF